MADVTSRVLSIEQMNRLSHAADGTFGFTTLGGAVTVSANMVLNVAAVPALTCIINSTALGTAYSASTVTVSASDPTNPRLDIVWINSSGVVAVAAGTPAAITTSTGPVPPTIGATGIELAMILVGAGVTAITANDIIDRRQWIGTGSLIAGRLLTEATGTTATAFDLATLTLSRTITARQAFRITLSYRKTAGAASAAGFGLKLNSTTVVEANGPAGICGTTATSQAEDGVCTVLVGPRSTNYVNGIVGSYFTRISATGAYALGPVQGAVDAPNQTLAASLLTADITSITIRGYAGSASNTIGVKDIIVEVLP